ncbi:MAG: tetratricopeptide repeat protein, partial [Chitinophagales bacterium]
MKTQHLKYILVCFSLVMMAGCAKQNAGIIKQTYNDLTGHYNTYFNANELYKETIGGIEENRTENYTQIIPLYAYGTVEDTKAQEASFQTVQEKATKSIQLHQISNWADDAFLLVGKTYYMQGNYENAIESFRYITANYKEGVDGRSDKKIKKQKNSKKRKAKEKKQEEKDIEALLDGKDIRPKDGLFEHSPARSEALVWMVKAFASNEQYTEADAILTFIRADKDFYKNYDTDVELANAFVYMEQEKYENALEHIEASLELIKRQKKKARYQFVAAQLYQTLGNKEKAAEYFKQSIKANPDFEMQFYAKLNMIKMSREGDYETKDAEKLIAKLLRDRKNKDFYDQLYYEKALFALADNEREDAKELLTKSIESSVNNDLQKAQSYILLADLNYEEEIYVDAQALYDSSLALIDNEYENYYFIQNRSTVLTDLVEQLDIINRNDSLLFIANMPEKEREDFLYKLAVDIVEAEEKAAAKSNTTTLVASENTSDSKGAWYFYSESLRSKGQKKFKNNWGERTLEDDWRRADKSGGDFAIEDDSTNTNGANDAGFFTKVNEKYDAMLAELPTSDEDKTAYNNEIKDAYFEGAMIYKSGLENLPKSIQLLESLIAEYPKNEYKEESYYHLYLMYAQLDNKTKSDKYKNLLLGTYPDSDFAKILKNPDYIEELAAKENEAKAYYEATYVMYGNGQYDQVLTRYQSAKTQFPNNPLQAKFDLLKALAVGGKKQREEYENSLEYVVSTHANTEEQVKAEELLAYLRGEIPTDNDESNNEISPNGSKIDKVNSSIKVDKKDAIDT